MPDCPYPEITDLLDAWFRRVKYLGLSDEKIKVAWQKILSENTDVEELRVILELEFNWAGWYVEEQREYSDSQSVVSTECGYLGKTIHELEEQGCAIVSVNLTGEERDYGRKYECYDVFYTPSILLRIYAVSFYVKLREKVQSREEALVWAQRLKEARRMILADYMSKIIIGRRSEYQDKDKLEDIICGFRGKSERDWQTFLTSLQKGELGQYALSVAIKRSLEMTAKQPMTYAGALISAGVCLGFLLLGLCSKLFVLPAIVTCGLFLFSCLIPQLTWLALSKDIRGPPERAIKEIANDQDGIHSLNKLNEALRRYPFSPILRLLQIIHYVILYPFVHFGHEIVCHTLLHISDTRRWHWLAYFLQGTLSAVSVFAVGYGLGWLITAFSAKVTIACAAGLGFGCLLWCGGAESDSKPDDGNAPRHAYPRLTIERIRRRLFSFCEGDVRQIPIHIELARANIDAYEERKETKYLLYAQNDIRRARDLMKEHSCDSYQQELRDAVERLLHTYRRGSPWYHDFLEKYGYLLQETEEKPAAAITLLPEGSIYPTDMLVQQRGKIADMVNETQNQNSLRHRRLFAELSVNITNAFIQIGKLPAVDSLTVNGAARYLLALVAHNEWMLMMLDQMSAGEDRLKQAQGEMKNIVGIRDTLTQNRHLLNQTQQQLLAREDDRFTRQIQVRMAAAEQKILANRAKDEEAQRLNYTFDKAAFDQMLAAAEVAQQESRFDDAEALLYKAADIPAQGSAAGNAANEVYRVLAFDRVAALYLLQKNFAGAQGIFEETSSLVLHVLKEEANLRKAVRDDVTRLKEERTKLQAELRVATHVCVKQEEEEAWQGQRITFIQMQQWLNLQAACPVGGHRAGRVLRETLIIPSDSNEHQPMQFLVPGIKDGIVALVGVQQEVHGFVFLVVPVRTKFIDACFALKSVKGGIAVVDPKEKPKPIESAPATVAPASVLVSSPVVMPPALLPAANQEIPSPGLRFNLLPGLHYWYRAVSLNQPGLQKFVKAIETAGELREKGNGRQSRDNYTGASSLYERAENQLGWVLKWIILQQPGTQCVTREMVVSFIIGLWVQRESALLWYSRALFQKKINASFQAEMAAAVKAKDEFFALKTVIGQQKGFLLTLPDSVICILEQEKRLSNIFANNCWKYRAALLAKEEQKAIPPATVSILLGSVEPLTPPAKSRADA
ncbi:MAG: hypothetical protein NTU54_00325, partial [Candidatus Omnitrophica bacterium]|nr:hypothetical protein [Candidatus Omnitrophota bacterium]